MIVAEEFGPLAAIPGVAWSDYGGMPHGWGREYRGKANTTCWFHAAVPTQVMYPEPLEGFQRILPELLKVYILYNAEANCHISDVHVWDGASEGRPIHTRDHLRFEGDHSLALDDLNTIIIPRAPGPSGVTHYMLYGLGISVLVNFRSETTITFTAAGAEFRIAALKWG